MGCFWNCQRLKPCLRSLEIDPDGRIVASSFLQVAPWWTSRFIQQQGDCIISVEFGNPLRLLACRLQAMAVWMASAKGCSWKDRLMQQYETVRNPMYVSFLAFKRGIERGALPGNTCHMQVPRLESRDRRRLMVATDQQQMGPQKIGWGFFMILL